VVVRPLNFTVRGRVRDSSVKVSRKLLIRLTALALGVCMVGAMANEYMGLGWFGQRAKLVSMLLVILILVFWILSQRWLEKD